MSDIQKKIDEIEAEMARTQKNKATNYHIGTLKAKLAKLRSELLNGPGGKSAGKLPFFKEVQMENSCKMPFTIIHCPFFCKMIMGLLFIMFP